MDKLEPPRPASQDARPVAEALKATRTRAAALPRIRAEVDRIERITVCTRPFRAEGPRIEPERVGDKLVIHNYGHGGSGWSLSWGSAALVVPMALREGAREVAVIGCGALGLTAAIALQRAGAKVTIYARDLPPQVRSSRATGLWSPDSRIALARVTDATFAGQWEQMARRSWAVYQHSLDLPGKPVELHNRYLLSELPPDEEIAQRHREDWIGFAHLDQTLRDLYAAPVDLRPGEHPFPTAYCRQISILRFNITAYSEQLMTMFRQAGGVIVQREFRSPNEFGALREDTLVHCTGYGAKALFDDASVTPVRGQIGWLPAQPEVEYSLQYGRLSVVSRGDGVVVQVGASSDDTGWNDAGEQPNREEAEDAVRRLARLQQADNVE